MDIVPGTASDVLGVINNIDDGEVPWIELAVKILYTHKRDWDDDSKMYKEIDLPMRHSGWNKWHSWVIIDPTLSNGFSFSFFYHFMYKNNRSWLPFLPFIFYLFVNSTPETIVSYV